MKFERYFEAEVVDFQILTDDYSKMALLLADRSIVFQARCARSRRRPSEPLHASVPATPPPTASPWIRYGTHYKMRFPKQGRDLAYLPFLADLAVVGSAPEIYRLSLSEGRFMTPVPSKSPAINACGFSPEHGLFGCAGEDGVLECFDMRTKASVGSLDAASAAGAPGEQLTALRFDDSGMHIAVGTSTGQVAVYDLRSSRPLVVKDHMYGTRIVDLKFQRALGDGTSGRKVVSTDTHIVKVWDVNDGKPFTSIQPPEKSGDINDLCLWPGSGLMIMGMDSPNLLPFFVPALGPAPRWCSFLEGLTEELEESAAPALYDDYKFVTRGELERLGLGHLLGTPMLRAYMHGYFLDHRLYRKAKAIAEPFAYETYRQQRIEEKMEAERKSRIGVVKKLPKVNAMAAARLLQKQEEGGKEAAVAASVLADDRFKKMFENPAFRIDEESIDYRLLHPNARAEKEQDALLKEHFEELQSASEEDGSVSQCHAGAHRILLHFTVVDPFFYRQGEDSEDEREAKRRRTAKDGFRKAKELPVRAKEPRMFVARDDTAAEAFRRNESLEGLRAVPLAHRAAAVAGESRGGLQMAGGSKEMSFVPESSRGGGRGRGGRGGRGGRSGGRGGGGRGRGRGGRR